MNYVEVAIWAVAFVVFLLAEASTVSLVSIWFMAGALAALIVALCGGAIWLQILLFAVVSGVLLALFRPWLKKYFQPKVTATNAGALVGKIGVVTEAIDNLEAAGCVKIDSVLWSARGAGGSTIPVGAQVVVRKIEGVKVIVDLAETSAAVSKK